MQIVVSTDSTVPIYEQIKTQARAAILAGDLAVDSTLPSLRQLAAELRVSVITITRAYNDLVAEGLVRNEHGRGFVVRAVDPETAASALRSRVDQALRELRTAAGHARLGRADVHRLIDESWSSDD